MIVTDSETEMNAMIKNYSIKLIKVLSLMLMTIAFAGIICTSVKASEAGEVAIVGIDYEDLTMKIDPNGNSIVYYSKDKSNWFELEYYTDGSCYVMDISWANATADVKLYFKGDKNSKVVNVVLPKKNSAFKATFDKVEGTVELDEFDDATVFQWRKTTDYNWKTVSVNQSDISYKLFMDELENLRFKGGKIIVRTPAVAGKSAIDTGARPSKEITLSIPKRNNAPSVSVNIKKLTINTTDKMEYKLSNNALWLECDKNMELSELINLSVGGTIQIRTAATETNTYSKTLSLIIPAQRPAPALPLYYYENKKFVMQFSDAGKSNPYEYTIVKAGDSYDPVTAVWKSVTSSNVIKLSESTVPSGSMIFIRSKGVAANATKGTPVELPSDTASIAIRF